MATVSQVSQRADDGTDLRTAELAFSSEGAVVPRWFGGEVLGHGQGEIRMDFMQSGRAPLLMFHDPERVVGVVQAAEIGSDRVGRATVRFGRSAAAEEALQNVRDGVLTNVSVGYRVNSMVLESSSDEGGDVYRVDDWEPLEVSLVSIPADQSVGVGRAGPEEYETTVKIKTREAPAEERKMSDDNKASPPAEVRIDLAAETAKAAGAERARAREISDLASRHNLGAIGAEHVEKGTSIEAFRGIVLDAISERGSSKPLQEMPGDLKLSDAEKRSYSLTRAVRAHVDALTSKRAVERTFETELSEEIAKKAGRESRGFFVPYDFMARNVGDEGPSLLKRTLTASGGVATGGAVVQSTVVGSQYVPPNYNVPVVVKAGARVLSGLQGNVLIPAMTSGKSVTWVTPENTAVTAADPTFAQISLTPKDMGTVVDISRRLLLQSNPAVDGLLRDDIAMAIANGLDAAAINGSGSSGQPLGLLGQSIGVQAGGTNGAALTWANLTYLPQLIAAANRLVGPLSFVGSAAAFFHAARTVKVANYPTFLAQYEENLNAQNGMGTGSMMGYQFHTSQNVPSNLAKGTGTNLSAVILGHWSDLLIGEWGVLDMLVDPYTFSNTGAIRIRAFMTVDVGVRYAGSFATIKDIVTT